MKRVVEGAFVTLLLNEQEVQEYSYAVEKLTNSMWIAETQQDIEDAINVASSMLEFADLVWEKKNQVVVLVSEGIMVNKIGREGASAVHEI